MDINIIKKGISRRLSGIGVYAKDFSVSSIEIESSNEKVEGYDGYLETGVSFGSRTISVPFYFRANDMIDFQHKRDELFGVVMSKEPFHIQEIRRPEIMSYPFTDQAGTVVVKADDHEVSVKRYKVRLKNVFEIEQTLRYGEGELLFTTIDQPFAESVNVMSRVFKANSFVFPNGGNLPINMRTQNETEIIFSGASDGLSIMNVSTGDIWTLNTPTVEGDVVVLKGVQSHRNEHSVFKDTNKRLIGFGVGNNEFEITGTIGDFTLEIKTRFYFL